LSNTAEYAKRIARAIALIGIAYAKLTRCSRNTELSDLPNESRLRRERAHDVANVLGSLHMDGLDVDPEALAIAQHYVDGEISVAQMRAAVSSVRQFRAKTTASGVWFIAQITKRRMIWPLSSPVIK
jgi:hypothetical protein